MLFFVVSYVTCLFFFFFNATATTGIYTIAYTLSLPDALPICGRSGSSPHLQAVSLLLQGDTLQIAESVSLPRETPNVGVSMGREQWESPPPSMGGFSHGEIGRAQV